MIETVPSGTVLYGRYRIERVLGSGGFGHVYQALDLSTNQQYALKEYLVSGPSGQEQLMHEANVLSQLHHPNLPAFHDAFNERGRYYVVLNYIEGNDLTDIIRIAQRRNEVVPITQIMTWMVTICDAVIFLHAQRPPVIHRDIKPDNIRIMPDGTAILVDLGNAKASADGSRTLFFIRHQGTPGYAPPEQYPGGSGTDVRSDIYALGGTLYFALTSHEPPSVSNRNQSIQQGQHDLPSLQELLAKNPPENSPEANAAKQFRLGVSKPAKPAPRHSHHLAQLGSLPSVALSQLNTIIQRAMAIRPKDRYQSTADFANDLRRVMTTMSASTVPTPMQQASPNPYSTQPDLPMLYEAMQSAKAVNDHGTSDVSQSSTPSTPAIQRTCPRCNAPLKPSSAFCPSCGLPLTDRARANSWTNRTDAATSASSASSQQSTTSHGGSSEQTIIAMQQGQQTPQTFPSTTFPVIQSTTPNTTSRGSSPWDTVPVAPQDSAYDDRTSTDSGQIQPMQQPPAKSSSGFNVGPGLIIAIVIILLILVAIMVLLLINHAHAAFMQFPAASINLHITTISANIRF